MLHTLDRQFYDIPEVAFSPGSDLYVFPSGEVLNVFQTSNNTLVRTLPGATDPIISVTFSPDGTQVAAGVKYDEVLIWRISGGDPIQIIQNASVSGHDFHLSYSPDGTLLAVACSYNVYVIQISDGQILFRLSTTQTGTNDVAFSPDGNFIAATSENDILIWDVSDGSLVQTLHGHTAEVTSLAYSPDGSLLVSGSYDDTIRVWRISDGRLLLSVTGSTRSIYDVAFSPDGSMIASAANDGTASLWRATDGLLLHTMEISHSDGFLTFSPDGTLLVTSDSGIVRFWGVP